MTRELLAPSAYLDALRHDVIPATIGKVSGTDTKVTGWTATINPYVLHGAAAGTRPYRTLQDRKEDRRGRHGGRVRGAR